MSSKRGTTQFSAIRGTKVRIANAWKPSGYSFTSTRSDVGPGADVVNQSLHRMPAARSPTLEEWEVCSVVGDLAAGWMDGLKFWGSTMKTSCFQTIYCSIMVRVVQRKKLIKALPDMLYALKLPISTFHECLCILKLVKPSEQFYTCLVSCVGEKGFLLSEGVRCTRRVQVRVFWLT